MRNRDLHIRIMGCRGVPARHGGFETFAERLALFLLEQGCRVTVYCQQEGDEISWEDEWRGVRRVHIPVRGSGAVATLSFDWRVLRHAMGEEGVALVLGYGSGYLTALQRLAGIPTVTNMDGLEWSRSKYGLLARTWLWANEALAAVFSDRLIGDHPIISAHLTRWGAGAKTRMIPYGADEVEADPSLLKPLGLTEGGYYLVIARPEPENSIAEIIRAFSEKRRKTKLVILGNYGDSASEYARNARRFASDQVVFPGAIYDKRTVPTLRACARGYIHGHTVGGTNPSLVESMATSTPILAHGNAFNRWVAGSGALYWDDHANLCAAIDDFDKVDPFELARMGAAVHDRFVDAFQWPDVLETYLELLREAASELAEGTTPAMIGVARSSLSEF